MISRTRHMVGVAYETGIAPDDCSQPSKHRHVPVIDARRIRP
ncbi:MAG: hypothetical protein OXQ84_02025 [bacterium]|nr:hypothetical protein [bacterium]